MLFVPGNIHCLTREERKNVAHALASHGDGLTFSISSPATRADVALLLQYTDAPEGSAGFTSAQASLTDRAPRVWCLDTLELYLGLPLGSLVPRLRFLSSLSVFSIAAATAALESSAHDVEDVVGATAYGLDQGLVASASATGGTQKMTGSVPDDAVGDVRIALYDSLQLTDLKNNSNKFYVLELFVDEEDSAWVVANFGRTIGGVSKGQQVVRSAPDLACAVRMYWKILHQKTGKGYLKVNLASSSIGSLLCRARSDNESDVLASSVFRGKPRARNAPPVRHPLSDVTASQDLKNNSKSNSKSNGNKGTSKGEEGDGSDGSDGSDGPNPEVATFVDEIYQSALESLTARVSGTITSRGIETPLGVLSLSQVRAGREALEAIRVALERDASRDRLLELSSAFYAVVPHDMGRSGIAEQNIDSPGKLRAKVQLVQLMEDVVSVAESAPGANVLVSDDLMEKYYALNASVSRVDPASAEYRKIIKHITITDVKDLGIAVKNVFAVSRPGEPSTHDLESRFGNVKNLFHGSRASNWVGLISRGILLPQMIVSSGRLRTDAGALGAGVYFGSDASTAAQYCTDVDGSGSSSRFMAIAAVGLGQVAELTSPAPHLTGPPSDASSVHGKATTADQPSSFIDDEYVVFSRSQYALRYVVEFTAHVDDARLAAAAAAAKAAADNATSAAGAPTFFSTHAAPVAAPQQQPGGPRVTPVVFYDPEEAARAGFVPGERPLRHGRVLDPVMPPLPPQSVLTISVVLTAIKKLSALQCISAGMKSALKTALLCGDVASPIWTEVVRHAHSPLRLFLDETFLGLLQASC